MLKATWVNSIFLQSYRASARLEGLSCINPLICLQSSFGRFPIIDDLRVISMAAPKRRRPNRVAADFWQMPTDALFSALDSSPAGLSQTEADRRLAIFGKNRVEASQSRSILHKLGQRILNPLVAMLLVAAAISGVSGDFGSFVIIVAVLSLSLTLDIVQEHRAEQTAEALRDSVAVQADVMRDGADRFGAGRGARARRHRHAPHRRPRSRPMASSSKRTNFRSTKP